MWVYVYYSYSAFGDILLENIFKILIVDGLKVPKLFDEVIYRWCSAHLSGHQFYKDLSY